MNESESPKLAELGLVALGDQECETFLEQTQVGRVVFLSGEYPIALPVNYRWFERSVVFRTLEGRKLNAAVSDRPISFEIDGWDAARHSGWSVLVKGRGRQVENWAEQEELEQLGLAPWSQGDWKVRWVRLDADSIEGRTLLP